MVKDNEGIDEPVSFDVLGELQAPLGSLGSRGSVEVYPVDRVERNVRDRKGVLSGPVQHD